MATTIKNTSVNAVNDAINNLVSLNILTSQDKKIIKDKLIINFVSSCKKITGDHKIQKYFDGDATTPYKKSLEEISLNISLCDSYQYIDQLDQQVKKLAIHEIGHYIYYFKDNSPTTFQSICRDANGAKKDSCGNTSFITTYAQTNSEEDYAETFSRRGITKINKDKKYLAYYTHPLASNSNTVTTSTSHGSASDATELSQKFNYFDTLVKKF